MNQTKCCDPRELSVASVPTLPTPETALDYLTGVLDQVDKHAHEVMAQFETALDPVAFPDSAAVEPSGVNDRCLPPALDRLRARVYSIDAALYRLDALRSRLGL